MKHIILCALLLAVPVHAAPSGPHKRGVRPTPTPIANNAFFLVPHRSRAELEAELATAKRDCVNMESRYASTTIENARLRSQNENLRAQISLLQKRTTKYTKRSR